MLVRLVWLPVLGAVAEQRAMLHEVQVKMADAELVMARLSEEEEALAEVRERFNTFERWVGYGKSMARVLETLSQRARDHRLELVAIQPPVQADAQTIELSPGLRLREVPVQLTLTGRYRNIGAFLGELAEAPFLTSVRLLKIVRPEGISLRLQADVVLGVYLGEGA
jgi:Tfp pilus assembly protein PilO